MLCIVFKHSPFRAMSVDPEQMLNTHTFEIHRPTSSQSVHASLSRRPNTDLGFVNTTHNSSSRPPSSQGFMLDHFITHLPVLDFGAAEAEGMEYFFYPHQNSVSYSLYRSGCIAAEVFSLKY